MDTLHPIVSVSWLAERLADPSIVILDATLPPVGVTPVVDTRGRYLTSHIPGAVFFDIDELSDHTSGLPHTLPSAGSFGQSMSALGVDNESQIVVYEQVGVFSAPRARWMLRTFGVEKVSILDGGLPAWIAAGLPTEAGLVQRAPARFQASLNTKAVADFAMILQAITAREQILDARSHGRFTGALPEPRPGLNSGHMPGAISVPFTELVRDGSVKSAEELHAYFESKGVDLTEPITASCGSGVTAAVVSLGLELAGAKCVILYDGSWAEYAQHPEAVIEKDI
jgi:thiosulfate/3-mercaptopyruvate sulfurtransferase